MTRTEAERLVRNLAYRMGTPDRLALLTPDDIADAMWSVYDILGWGAITIDGRNSAAKRIRAAIAKMDTDRHECGGRIVAGHTQNGPYYFCATCGDDNV